jgi:ribosomal-protein-serine acetyltransferase
MTLFPKAVETERLIIRPNDPTTAELVNEAIRESYAELHSWMPWAEHLPDLAETRDHLTESPEQYLAGVDAGLALWLKDNGRFVGGSGLHPRHEDPGWREIGYWVRSSLTGQGLATEAVRAIAETGFRVLGLEGVQIKASERNIASLRVAEKAGFVREGELEDGRIDPGGFPSRTVLFVLRRHGAQVIVGRT